MEKKKKKNINPHIKSVFNAERERDKAEHTVQSNT